MNFFITKNYDSIIRHLALFLHQSSAKTTSFFLRDLGEEWFKKILAQVSKEKQNCYMLYKG